jgi:hypothetical protein
MRRPVAGNGVGQVDQRAVASDRSSLSASFKRWAQNRKR